jgi:transcriptional regulator with XRE-family HTH domain
LSNRLREISKIVQAKKGWTLGEVAESIGYSRGHLTRLFKDDNTEAVEKLLFEKHKGLLQNDVLFALPHHGSIKNPAETEDSYRAKYIRKLEDDNALLTELIKSNQEIIKNNLTVVLATVRTISVRQEATGTVALESLARLEKKKNEHVLVDEVDKRTVQIETAAYTHGNAVG